RLDHAPFPAGFRFCRQTLAIGLGPDCVMPLKCQHPLRVLRPCPKGRCPSGLPAFATWQGSRTGGLRPSTCPPCPQRNRVPAASRPSPSGGLRPALTRLLPSKHV